MTSWNRRVAAASRVRETTDPDVMADRVAALGLPRGLHPDDASAVIALLRLAETRGDAFDTTHLGRVRTDDPDGEDHSVKIVIIGSERGATAFVGSTDDELRFDPLTGLPGRDYVLEAINTGLQSALTANHLVGVFAIDIDRFKNVNDTRGYAEGDETLRALAAELVSVLRPDDILSRPGGDEFTIVSPDVLGPAEATYLGEKFRTVCSSAPVDSPLAGLTLSIGIAVGGADRVAEDLLKEAETALFQAKALGRDRCEMFDDELRTRDERRISFDQRLRAALDDDTLPLHYQPIVEIATGEIVGAEALLRIAGEDGVHLDPRELVRAAEDSGLINRVEERVLERAAPTILALPEHDTGPLYLSVNVSDRRLNDSRFPLTLARALHNAGLPAELLRLELAPEVLEGKSIGSRLVTQLRALGVGVSIDEFSAPNDSVLIGRDGIDIVKLDRRLVQGIHDERGQARAEVVVAGLEERGVDVCAVGVETSEDLSAVASLGCRYAQGFLFSAPVPAEEFSRLVADGPS